MTVPMWRNGKNFQFPISKYLLYKLWQSPVGKKKQNYANRNHISHIKKIGTTIFSQTWMVSSFK